MKRQFIKYLAIGLPAISLFLVACGGGSSDQSATPSITYATFNPPGAQSTSSVGVTGIRGVSNSTDVYITGSMEAAGNVWSDQLYKGPITGGGTYFTMNYPNSTGTTSYSVDNLSDGGISLTGTFKTAQNSNEQGFLYQGPVINNPTTGWITINYPGAEKTNPHSVMGDFVVGGYYSPGDALIHAFIYQISTGQMRQFKVFDDDISTTAYGIWWNGGTSYTIVGGYGKLNTLGKGYILDYDASTGAKTNITTYSYNNQPSIDTHFEGITLDATRGYNLAGGATGATSLFLHVERLAAGGFTVNPKWIAANYPNSSSTSGDTVYKNYLLGEYSPGPARINGYVATIPESLYK